MKQTEFTGRKNRLFVAIVPDQIFFRTIRPQLESLKRVPLPGPVRWIPAGNIHLTVRFLGDTDHEGFLRLRNALHDCADAWKAFELFLSGLVFLPKASGARVIALGLQPSVELSGLADRVEQAVTACGFEPEKRPFRAHLTLGRCRPLDFRSFESPVKFKGLSFSVRSMELVKSSLSEKGAVYGTLETLKLMPDS